jgi:hypothetical protein
LATALRTSRPTPAVVAGPPTPESYRRCVRDYERLPASHEAMVLWAMVALMTQRLAQQR